ncbi:DUF7373 family lipoprotein [Nocardia seriolae]|uniref:Lipoprotein n=1 Tax=Nocardia seriolae TaxID=37332 RepID=A0ABC8B0Q2_9NOCA|nr:hypothetical protein [Nocardia seriolae]APA99830.1 hypothetical protein NS506_05791 [Nocardia seriolae]MTJ64528.1 hypothetical protein [Nocardia seriolae]MTJ74586.1 hypothetical protein [Nocardia seriolae]MTJ89372.1 hypothetical protein [Nocardia seriolae]MTK33348.1 hypothetical protein [Nocardia seriolae]
MTRTTKIACRAAAAIALLMVASGCTIDGKPVAHKPDPAALDTGRYGVEPLEPPAGTESTGRVLESARMTEVMLDPAAVDPALIHAPDAISIAPIPTPARASMLLTDRVRPVLERHGMVAGCMVGGSDVEPGPHGVEVGKGRVLVALVLRFPDAAAAQRAAAEIDSVDAAVSTENVAAAIPDYPAAHAHWRPAVPSMAATVAHDDYVISLLMGHTSPDLGALTGLARKAFDAQIPLLHGFAATPVDRFSALPLDPDRMIRLQVPDAPNRWTYPGVVSLGNHRAAGWNTSPVGVGVSLGPRATAIYRGPSDNSAGKRPDAAATNGFNQLLRYPDAVSAHQRFEQARAKTAADSTLRPIDPPAGASDISCFQNLDPDPVGMSTFMCRMQYGRYTAIVLARDATGVRQRAAAQYGLLVNGG